MLQTQFIQQQYKSNTFSDENNISNVAMYKPEIANNLIRAFGTHAANMGNQNYSILQYLTAGSRRIAKFNQTYKPIGADEIQWPLLGNIIRAIPISGTVNPQTEAGIGFTTFIVPFPEKYFEVGWVCRFEDDSMARVQNYEYLNGQWCYTFQLVTSNPSEHVANWALEPNREVAWDHSAYEEGSHGGGSVVATPMWLRNQLTITRLAMGVTGSAKNTVITLKTKETKNGKEEATWMTFSQYQYLYQWSIMQEKALFNSRYNKLSDGTFANIGENGRPVKTGSGLEEQLMGSNHFVVSELHEEMLWHMLNGITNASNEGGSGAQKMVITGNGGVWEFQKAIRNASVELQQINTEWTDKKGEKLAFGAEYSTYKGPSGSTFTIVNHPMFNDKTCYPGTVGPHGYTRQSYKMFFVDFSERQGEPNVQMITRGANGENRQLVQWYTAGATTPNWDRDTPDKATDIGKIMRSHSGDYSMLYTLSETGCLIKDPFSCGLIEIIPPNSN